MNKIYTGIGSRVVPDIIIKRMLRFGQLAARLGWTLRSGAATGSDEAFEMGCDSMSGSKEIFLPYKGFNHHQSNLYPPPREAYVLASTIHLGYNKIKNNTRGKIIKALLARNMLQVLGEDLDTPSEFVICWTPDGCERHENYCVGVTGGTGTAIALASKHNIPVFNIGSDERYQEAILYMLTITGEIDGC